MMSVFFMFKVDKNLISLAGYMSYLYFSRDIHFWATLLSVSVFLTHTLLTRSLSLQMFIFVL